MREKIPTGPPRKTSELKYPVNVSMTHSERDMADKASEKRDLSRSAYIVELVKEDCEDG